MKQIKKSPDKLANMSVEDLISLKDQIERLLRERVDNEKRVLTAKLVAIERFEAEVGLGAAFAKDKRTNGAVSGRAKVAAKYRNPDTGETWAGRGMQPRWLRRAIEAGRRQEDFLIS